ncbi:aldo/keto reductase [Halegenticoccus tardaugens]|uniref:aldo/keto reductase n=1 Tax=Halegenticoccus tardaugens TaxID=2071624 RepID=UPI00100AF346|nr:aldo/keto reductase [Halegenticoccus tardaugens]
MVPTEYVTVRGVDVPALGLGTARMTGEECADAVASALDLGYRHVDTAQMYDNEEAVGRAIRESDVPRDEVFLTTKLHPSNLARDDTFDSFRGSLDRLDTEVVDLLLIHAPREYVPVEETLGAMNDLREAGEVRHVGVSNFSVAQLEAAMDASDAPILTNQVEYHPYKRQDDLLAFCVENDVMLTAYSPLDVGDLADDDALAEIGDRHGKTPSQVALRWLIQQEHVSAIPKASRRAHQLENIEIFDFELSADEMARIFERRGGVTDRLRSLFGL